MSGLELQLAFVDVLRIYSGSDGAATMALYKRLEELGPAGEIAVNLFRAQKSSARAKVYRGGGFRGKAYDKKQWSMGNVAAILTRHAGACALPWGWGIDRAEDFHNVVCTSTCPRAR